MISEELLQQWLDALETCMQVDQQWQIFDADKVRVATKSLRAAIAQPESEPVGTVDEGDDGLFVDLETPNGVAVKRGDKLYLAAQKPAYVPLTDEQIDQAITLTTSNRPFGWRCFARAIEKQVRGES